MATDIEHFRPKSGYPSYAFTWANYLLACSHCNSNEKRNRFPMRGDTPLLIDPSAANPFDHLAFSPTTGLYVPIDDVGAASIDVFGLNRDVCVLGRLQAWVALCALIRNFDVAAEDEQERILSTIARFPFQGVRYWMVSFLDSGNATSAVPDDVREIINRWPELAV